MLADRDYNPRPLQQQETQPSSDFSAEITIVQPKVTLNWRVGNTNIPNANKDAKE